MKTKKGFTLVEILIVVVILGILAAIVIPQFTNASTEARESSLVSNLQSVRSQIELFKIQHNNDMYPGSGTASFELCMTGPTDLNGAVVAVGTAGAKGPYMKELPVNPFSPNTALLVDDSGAAATGDDSHNWHYDPATGVFTADDSQVNLTTTVDHILY